MDLHIDTPVVGPETTDEFDELYALYRQFLSDAQAEVCRCTPAGQKRDELLAYCEPLPREHFEARLEAARTEPERYGRIVRQLQSGYAA